MTRNEYIPLSYQSSSKNLRNMHFKCLPAVLLIILSALIMMVGLMVSPEEKLEVDITKEPTDENPIE